MTRNLTRANGTFEAEPARVVPFPGRTPERLVGVGFRGWLSGFETGDITTWETTWNAYEETLGTDTSKPVILALSHFVRAAMASAQRDIEIYPAQCRGFCRDECLAISVIAGCQHDERNALCTCAAALIGSNDIGEIIMRAQDFAHELKAAGQVLSATSICSANCPLFVGRPRLQ